MPAEAFRPTLFFNEQCPFCMKVRIFLLESGLRDSVDIKEFSPGSAEETAIKQMLGTHLEKVSVPAAELSAGEYVADSGAIIARRRRAPAPNWCRIRRCWCGRRGASQC